jgi:hypothetical protein
MEFVAVSLKELFNLSINDVKATLEILAVPDK